MPAGQPFTRLCQQYAHAHSEAHRADLHLHTRHSDGEWQAAEVVERARRRGLGAIAITDHDIVAGAIEAQTVARRTAPTLEIIVGVEITCSFHDRTLHLLGYFIRPDDAGLNAALVEMRRRRRERFQAMADRLPSLGIEIGDAILQSTAAGDRSLGRRDLAAVLVAAGQARSVHEAIMRFLRDGGPLMVPVRGLAVGEAIDVVHRAGGVCSWAHPPADVAMEDVLELRDRGLDALEAVHPAHKTAQVHRLREWAATAGLAISGGSDCHGPTPNRRALGSYAITRAEVESLRALQRRD